MPISEAKVYAREMTQEKIKKTTNKKAAVLTAKQKGKSIDTGSALEKNKRQRSSGSSMLSTESPPFSPKGIMRASNLRGGSRSPAPSSSRPQSSTSSPVPFHRANGGYSNAIRSTNGASNSSGEAHSNAIPRHSFTGPDG